MALMAPVSLKLVLRGPGVHNACHTTLSLQPSSNGDLFLPQRATTDFSHTTNTHTHTPSLYYLNEGFAMHSSSSQSNVHILCGNNDIKRTQWCFASLKSVLWFAERHAKKCSESFVGYPFLFSFLFTFILLLLFFFNFLPDKITGQQIST